MRVMRIGAKAHDLKLMEIPDSDHDTGDYASLHALQEIVGGYIEPCAPAELRARNIQLLCNEEGLLENLPLNQNLFPFFFVGDLVAVGVHNEDFVSLSEKQVDYLIGWIERLTY